jgi:hypothetical protein
MKGNRPAEPAERHDYVIRRIQEDKAEAVRSMFRMYATGYGPTAIAKALNADPGYTEQSREFFAGRRVPSARHGTGSWSPTAVREILRRTLSHGEILWGRSIKTDKGGRAGITV